MQSVIERNQNHLLVLEILAGEEIGGSLEEQTAVDEDHNRQFFRQVQLQEENQIRPASAKTATTVVG